MEHPCFPNYPQDKRLYEQKPRGSIFHIAFSEPDCSHMQEFFRETRAPPLISPLLGDFTVPGDSLLESLGVYYQVAEAMRVSDENDRKKINRMIWGTT